MSVFLVPQQFYNDEKGRTYPKMRLYFYETNTFNFKNVYSDAAKTQLLENPVIADGAGRLPLIYMDVDTEYRVWAKDRRDMPISPYIDNYSPVSEDAGQFSVAETVADLRTIEPKFENQVITLIGHTVAGVGGGTFFFDNSDLSTEVAADSLGGVYVGIPSDLTGASGAWVRRDKDFVTPQMFGALEDGVTDSTSEIEANISGYSNSVISGDISYDLSISNATADNNYALAYFRKIFSGIRTATGRALSGKPSVVIEKHSAADTSATNLQDNGFVVSCSKKDDVSGSGMRAFYAYVEPLVGDGGSIAIHGRARTTSSDARIWGGWFYADRASTTLTRTIGTEVNVRNNTADAPYDDSLAGGGVDGLVSATVDSTYICNNSVVVTASSGGGWRTGVRVRADSIAPEVAGEGEAHLVRGATSSGNKYGGFKFLDGNFTYGTKYNGPTYENKAAIWMAKDDKIIFGDTTSASTWITYNSSSVYEIKGNALDFQLSSGSPLRINGDTGATGTFTTTDGKTVTVTGGLITTIV